MGIVINHLNFNLKHHDKYKFALTFIPLATTSNLFSLEVVESVDSNKCLWAFIECFKRFFGLQSSLGITNVNRSHNKPLKLIETI